MACCTAACEARAAGGARRASCSSCFAALRAISSSRGWGSAVPAVRRARWEVSRYPSSSAARARPASTPLVRDEAGERNERSTPSAARLKRTASSPGGRGVASSILHTASSGPFWPLASAIWPFSAFSPSASPILVSPSASLPSAALANAGAVVTVVAVVSPPVAVATAGPSGLGSCLAATAAALSLSMSSTIFPCSPAVRTSSTAAACLFAAGPRGLVNLSMLRANTTPCSSPCSVCSRWRSSFVSVAPRLSLVGPKEGPAGLPSPTTVSALVSVLIASGAGPATADRGVSPGAACCTLTFSVGLGTFGSTTLVTPVASWMTMPLSPCTLRD
eukprot:Colp12_sorted_trinity150504_noHs@28580